MSSTADTETLFSLELLVDYVQVGPGTRPGPLLAVAFRLLDFPTLLVHQTEPERAESLRRSWERGKENAAPELPGGGDIPFCKGKSCLFKISLASLHGHLTSTPLYAMLLDVFPRVPKLVGSCLISLAGAVEKIRREVEEYGIAMPSVHGGKGLHALYNLMGGKIGHISVGYRLLSLGAGLLPHIPENQVLQVRMRDKDFPLKPLETPVLPNGPCLPVQIKEESEKDADQVTWNTPAHSDLAPGDRVLVQHIQLNESEVPVIISVPKEKGKPNKLAKGTKMEHKLRLQRLETEQSTDISVDNVFCPPPLYYSQSTDEPKDKLTEKHGIVEPEAESAPLEELDSDEDSLKKGLFGMSQSLSNSRLPESLPESASRLKPKVRKRPPQSDPGNIIRQLPLLNALLLELSLLHDQRIPLAVHPQLAWLYSGLENDLPEFHKQTRSTTSEHPRSTSSNFKKHKKRFQKQPISQKLSDKENTPKQPNKKKDSEHPKRKLMYGLTNTLRLRLQQTNPDVLILHEQRELSRKKQLEQLKEKKTMPTRYKGKGERASSTLQEDQHLPGAFSYQSGCFEENIETLIQNSVELDSPHSSKVLRNGKLSGKNNFGTTSELESATSKGRMCVQPLRPLNHCVELSDFQKLNKATNDRILIGKDVKICLPKIFNHDSDHSVNEAYNEEVNPGFTIDPTIVEDSDAQISSKSCNGSPDPKYSEDFTSPEPAGYSEDFTSPEPTSRCADTLGSSTEATSTKVKRIYSNNESESRLSKHSSDSQGAAQSEREDDSVPLPAPSEQSPIQSLKGIYIVKSHHQRVALSSASNLSDDATSSIEGNQLKNTLNPTNKVGNKKQCKSTIPQGSRADINLASTEIAQLSSSRNGHRSLEESQSLGTSQVSSYVPSSVSDLACSGHEMNTSDIQEDDVDEFSTMGVVNECKHVSELVANKLPGYTL
ncbi:microtubule-associated protein 10 [Heptranchias perlo]|uniref:microtubule-associated protein 10 n=1 Tax=Heptranchias perlo TaxID=212740 RepID=UPI003559E360